MLEVIECDLFTEKKVVFKEGLNVILGDDKCTNSIGKSTLLMIVDFVFGGDTYPKKDSGSISSLGHHSFKFCFVFDYEKHYFKRETANPNSIIICNSEYLPIEVIDVEKYTNFLKEKYIGSQSELTFRSIVSLYSRIWGKDNNNVDKPLQGYLKELESSSVSNLIKIFGRYSEISLLLKKIDENTKSKKILSGAIKRDFVKSVTKTDYKVNENRVNDLKNQIEEIKNNLLEFTLNLNQLKNKQVLELREQKNKLISSENILRNKLKRIDMSLNQKSNIHPKQLKSLNNFFPNINLERIEQIESFHNKLSSILKKQFLYSKEKITNELEKFQEQMAIVDKKIDENLSGIESPKYIIDRVLDLTLEINKLENSNKVYDEKVQIDTNISESKEDLGETMTSILSDIQVKINHQMTIISEQILGKERKAPEIHLFEKKYNFDHFNNTGTGKSFIDLIIFDLSILELTKLPILIHDSPLFKNIEDFSIDKIISAYNSFRKQIFISIDGINRYSVESNKILTSRKVLSLSNEKLLFNKDWRPQ